MNKSTALYTFDGKTKSLPEWSAETGINYWTLQCRINRYNWTLEEAFTTPINKNKSNYYRNLKKEGM